jgi:hypothetical protein
VKLNAQHKGGCIRHDVNRNHSLTVRGLNFRRRGTVTRTATLAVSMQKFETIDPKLARRCRYALHRGEKARLTIEGIAVSGIVRSVFEDKTSNPRRWIVTVVLKPLAAA